MRRFTNYRINYICKDGNYNHSLQINFSLNGKSYSVDLDSGTHDNVEIYRDKNRFFVLSANTRLNYLGVQVFEIDGNGSVSEFLNAFEQNPDENPNIGSGWEYLAPYTLIRRLVDFD